MLGKSADEHGAEDMNQSMMEASRSWVGLIKMGHPWEDAGDKPRINRFLAGVFNRYIVVGYAPNGMNMDESCNDPQKSLNDGMIFFRVYHFFPLFLGGNRTGQHTKLHT